MGRGRRPYGDSHRGRYTGGSHASGHGKASRHSGRLHEDNRLMCLIRALENEENREHCSTGLVQIEDFLRQADGIPVVLKAGETALVELADLRETFPPATHDLLANCCGLVGVLLGGLKFFTWVFSRIRNSKLTDACRCWHLLTLQKAIESDQCGPLLLSSGPTILKDLHSILENASSTVLVAVVGALIAFSKVQPDAFRHRFRDIVDLLIGCHVDPEQPEATISCASESLISLHPFWVEDITFALAMISTFVEDMGTHCASCIAIESDEMPIQSLNKITALLKVLTTTACAVGTRFNPNHGPPVTASYVEKMIENIIGCVTQLSQCFFMESLLIAANGCLQVFAGCTQSFCASSAVAVGQFVVSQLDDSESPPTTPQVISAVSMISQVVQQVGDRLPTQFVDEVFGGESPVWALRNIPCSEILLPLLHILKTLLQSSGTAICKVTYNAIVADFRKHYAMVQDHYRQLTDLAPSSASAHVSVTISEAAMYTPLPTLEELANAKPLSIETDSEDEADESKSAFSSNGKRNSALTGRNSAGGKSSSRGDGAVPVSPADLQKAVACCVFDLQAFAVLASPTQQMKSMVQSLHPPLLDVIGLGNSQQPHASGAASASNGGGTGELQSLASNGSGSAPPTSCQSPASGGLLLLDATFTTDFPAMHHMLTLVVYLCCKSLDFFLPVTSRPATPKSTADTVRETPPVDARNMHELQHRAHYHGVPPPPYLHRGHYVGGHGPAPPMVAMPHPGVLPPFHRPPPPPPPPHFRGRGPSPLVLNPAMPGHPVPPPDLFATSTPPPAAIFPPPGMGVFDPGIGWSDLYQVWEPEPHPFTGGYDHGPWGGGGGGGGAFFPHPEHPWPLHADPVKSLPASVASHEALNSSESSSPKVNLPLASPVQFRQYLDLLVSLLKGPVVSTDTRLLALTWTRKLLGVVCEIPGVFSRHMDMSCLVQALLKSSISLEQRITIEAAKCLQVLFKAQIFPAAYLSEVVWTCMHRLGDASLSFRQTYLSLLLSVPPSFLTRIDNSLTDLRLGHTVISTYLEILSPRSMQSVHARNALRLRSSLAYGTPVEEPVEDSNVAALDWYWHRSTTARASTGSFSSHHFTTIMGFVLHGVTPLQHVNDDWLQRIYYSCKKASAATGQDDADADDGRGEGFGEFPDEETDLFAREKASCISDSMLWSWSMWQCAQHCVEQRLRTAFGSPQDTFQQLENVIRAIGSQVTGDQPRAFGDPPEGFANGSGVGPRHCTLLLRVRLILQLLDNLEKLMFNAGEGTAIALAAASKVARNFFRLNSGTCRAWVKRMHRLATPVALHSGATTAAVQMGMKWLRQIVASGDVQHADMDIVMSYVVRALIKLRCSDQIVGLMNWYLSLGGRTRMSLRWMSTAALQAQERLEEAGKLYCSLLQPEKTPDSTQPKVSEDVMASDVVETERAGDADSLGSVVNVAFPRSNGHDRQSTPPITMLKRGPGAPVPTGSSPGPGVAILARASPSRTESTPPVGSSFRAPQPLGMSTTLSKPACEVVASEALECYLSLTDWASVEQVFSTLDKGKEQQYLDNLPSLRRKHAFIRAEGAFDCQLYEKIGTHLQEMLDQANFENSSTPSTGSSSPSPPSNAVAGSSKQAALSDAESLCDVLWSPDEVLRSCQVLTYRNCASLRQKQLLTQGSLSISRSGSMHSLASMASLGDESFQDNASVGGRSYDSRATQSFGGGKVVSQLRRSLRQSMALLSSVVRVSTLDSPALLPTQHIAQMLFVNTLQQLVSGEQQLTSSDLLKPMALSSGTLHRGQHAFASTSLLLRSADFLFEQSLALMAERSADNGVGGCGGGEWADALPGVTAANFLRRCILLEVTRFARRQGNMTYARKLLVEQLFLAADEYHQSGRAATVPALQLLTAVSQTRLKECMAAVADNPAMFGERERPPSACTHERPGRYFEFVRSPACIVVAYLQHQEAAKHLYTVGQPQHALSGLCQISCGMREMLSTLQGSGVSSAVPASDWFQALPPLFPNTVLQKGRESLARSYLRLAKWFQNDSALVQQCLDNEDSLPGSAVRELVQDLPALRQPELSTLSRQEETCGRLLEGAVSYGGGLAKSWFTLAGWAYKLGRRNVDQSSDGSVQLLETEEEEVHRLLSCLSEADFQKAVKVIGRVHSSQASTEVDLSLLGQDEDVGVEESQDDSVITQLTHALPDLRNHLTAALNAAIIDIRRRVHDRVFSLYKRAVRCYFYFLKVGASQPNVAASQLSSMRVRQHIRNTSQSAEEEELSDDQGDGAKTATTTSPNPGLGESSDPNLLPQTAADIFQTTNTSTYSVDEPTAIATLRLLRLLVKHATELYQELEDGFRITPPLSWKGIIPQLFSRLNHPEASVRETLCRLLCCLGQEAPQLVIYPAVVGAMTYGRWRNPSESRPAPGSPAASLPPNALPDRGDRDVLNESDAHISSCLFEIVSTFSARQASLVSQTRLFVRELLRISLLWPEAWMQTLAHWQPHVHRALAQLDAEAKRLLANDTLALADKEMLQRKKHRAVLQLVLTSLDELQAQTSHAPQTRSEEHFQRAYKDRVAEAVNKLRSPADILQPLTAWDSAKELLQHLTQRSHRRAGNQLLLSEVSPKLAHLRSAAVFLPSLASEATVKETSTLQWMEDLIVVLPTKTRPKKLSIMGSDGRRHTYLFKGTEDLHLDERIMQFLNISNAMLSKENRSGLRGFQARHYAVTPIGPKAGLIEWVDGATALFALYRRWQQRTVQASQTAKGPPAQPTTAGAPGSEKTDSMRAPISSGSTSTNADSVGTAGASDAGTKQATARAPITRPSELFFSKMTPLLAAQGVTDMNNRKAWPMSCLRTAHDQLVAETPGDLLEMELWGSSSGSSEWWQLTQTYSRSLAVMSILGYLIGLGDRHLDNVMVDFVTGEVVHIDYNVCFEKGQTLRIPEKVPFRLTHNLEKALGLTGVEGTFRLSCERVLRLMKGGRETLLTLLEAFVYDPLVDWASSSSLDGHAAAAALALARGSSHRGAAAVYPARNQSLRSRLGMEAEMAINISLVVSRVAEIQLPWMQHCSSLLAALSELTSNLTSLAAVSQEIAVQRQTCYSLYQRQELLQSALTQPHQITFPDSVTGTVSQKEFLTAQLAALPQEITSVQLLVRHAINNGQAIVEQLSRLCGHVDGLLVSNKKMTAGCRQLLAALNKASHVCSEPAIGRAVEFLTQHKAFSTALRCVLVALGNVRMGSKDSLVYPYVSGAPVPTFTIADDDIMRLVRVSSNAHTLAAWLSGELLAFGQADDAVKMAQVIQCPDVDLTLDLSVAHPMAILTNRKPSQERNPASGGSSAPTPSAGLDSERGSVAMAAREQGAAVASASRGGGGATSAGSLARDPRTGKALQHRNMQAITVWKRVRSKLEGRDNDLAVKRLSVTEQVDLVIRHATNKDALCTMYEGWTSWV